MNFLLIFSTIFQLTRIGADEISRGPRPRPIVAKLSCPKWGTVIDGYCLWKGSHFPVKRDVADNLCKRSGGQVFLPIEKPKNLLLQRIYRRAGLSPRSPIWMNLEQVGFKTLRFKKESRRCSVVPKLKTNQTPRAPFWIRKYASAIFKKSRKTSYMKNVLYYPDGKFIRFYLVRKCDLAYPICTTKKIPLDSKVNKVPKKTTTTTTTTTTTKTTTIMSTFAFNDQFTADFSTGVQSTTWENPLQVSVRIQDSSMSNSDYSSYD